MNITHNKIDNTIEIKDNMKSNYFLYRFLMILNLLNATLQTSAINKTGLNVINGIWIFLGAISLVALWYLVFKKTAVNKISVNDIVSLKEQKTIFTKKQFSFKLKNGKTRDLGNFNKAEDLAKLKTLLDNIGVKY